MVNHLAGWWFGTFFTIYWESTDPNWRIPSFFRGVSHQPELDHLDFDDPFVEASSPISCFLSADWHRARPWSQEDLRGHVPGTLQGHETVLEKSAEHILDARGKHM